MTGKVIISLFDSIPLWAMVIPILGCSVVAFAVFIERMIFFSKFKNEHASIKENHSAVFSQDYDEAEKSIEALQGPQKDVLHGFISFKKKHGSDRKTELKQYLEDLSLPVVRKIERFAGVISTIATIAPMLGLLGTVTGMMKSFSGLSKLGPSARDVLASGITEALITTALGLMVAIPSIMLYNYMVSKIDIYVRDLEMMVNDMIDE